MNRVVDTYVAYQFIKLLNTPFYNWPAHEAGVIDSDGHVLVKRSNLTGEQRQVWGRFEVLVANLKKLLAKIPGGNQKIATIAATVLLLKEENIDVNDVDLLREELDNQIVVLKEMEHQDKNLLEGFKIKSAHMDRPEGFMVPHKVEKWHESRQNGWCVQVMDKHGNQVGDAEYIYHKRDAEVRRRELAKHHGINEEVNLLEGLKKVGNFKNAWQNYEVPLRKGRSKEALRQHIHDMLDYKHLADGEDKWHGTVGHGHDMTPSQYKVAQEMHANGEIHLEDRKYRQGGQKVHGAYGRHVGWGGSFHVHEFTITRKPRLNEENLLEDAPVNAAGGGAIAGIGVGPDGEPGRAKKDQKKKKGELPSTNLFTRKLNNLG